VEQEYLVNAQTELGNLAKVDGLVPGDSIVLDYVENSTGQRIVSLLVKEEDSSDSGQSGADQT
jgi:hypothetical protein